MLTAHQFAAAEATQIHGPYLKGTHPLRPSGSRLIISNAKNCHGKVYRSFICAGRHSKRTTCARQAILIEDYYQRVQITQPNKKPSLGFSATSSTSSWQMKPSNSTDSPPTAASTPTTATTPTP